MIPYEACKSDKLTEKDIQQELTKKIDTTPKQLHLNKNDDNEQFKKANTQLYKTCINNYAQSKLSVREDLTASEASI
jgi:hypothetical protein